MLNLLRKKKEVYHNPEETFQLIPKYHGPFHRDKVIYKIEVGNANCGFFAVYRELLELLYFADRRNMTPVVAFSKEFLYADEKDIKQKKNLFENYFKQPTSLQYDEWKNSAKIIHSSVIHSEMVRLIFTGKCDAYDANDLYVKQMARIHKKYIQLQPEVEQYLRENQANIIEGKRVLGVHVRGSDFKKNYHIHPIYVSPEEYIETIRGLMDEHCWEKIFLATDDESIIKLFKEAFQEKLVFYEDVYRSKSSTSVAFSVDKRERHKFRLGLEVLRDAYTLAACDGLLAGISQVSLAARIIKLSEKKAFSFLKIIHKGYNNNQKYFQRRRV